MPVRLRITLLFSLLVFVIFGMVCLSIYISAAEARRNMVNSKLINRAKNTARLLSRSEVFTIELIRRLDSITTMPLKEKVVQAYDYQDKVIYNYSDVPNDFFKANVTELEEARLKGEHYFEHNGKEAAAYHHKDNNIRMVVVAAGEDNEGRKSLNDLKQSLIISFLAGNLIVLAAGYFFAGRLISPVKKITNDVAEITAHNLVRRLQTGTAKDEWYHLASTLNDLLNRLQESFEMQRRFIANASHELSTPLTSISSQLEVALQRDRSANEYRNVIQSTYQDVKHMSKLTHTLLEFAKASGNAGGLELSRIRVDELILELPSQLVKMNPSYTVTIAFDELPEEEEKLLVYGNKPLLETAIRNIALNACKYSPDRKATIRLKADDTAISISIEDKGKGIPPEQLKTIFQPFYRGENNTAEAADGFGLGLSLSYRIVRLHKGSIHVESKVDKGSVFRIELPIAGNT